MNPYLKYAVKVLKSIAAIDLRVIATALVCVSILHICATLASPYLVDSTAFLRLKPMLPLNTMKILPPIQPSSQPLPFLSADVRYAMCRFSAHDTPVTVTAVLPDKGWTLAIHTPQGDNIYTATGTAARETRLTLRLVASKTSFTGLTPESRGRIAKGEPIQIVESREGIAILRAPDTGAAYARRTTLAIRRAKCFPSKQ